MPSTKPELFTPFRLGALELPNRVVMAPLTRNRATQGTDAPNALNAEYYRQRATAGLLITEATQISQQGQGYLWTPGLYTGPQVEGWQGVTKAVHGAHGRIFVQLWHVGRISHTSLQPGGGQPVAPSAIQAKGAQVFVESGFADASVPRALEADEIPLIVRDYVQAAENAQRAGFDGVEIHAANGYLLDQFMKDGPNHRTDAYGGSIENRIRFTLEVTDAILRVLPKGKVGIRLSPVSPFNDATDSKPEALFFALAEELNKRGLAYIHVIEGATGGKRDIEPFDYSKLRKMFHGAYIANNQYDRQLAIDTVARGDADLIAFGVPFIANPDLVARLEANGPMNKPDKATFYGGGEKGYTDYPFWDRAAAAE